MLDAKGDTPWMLQHDALSLNDLEFSLVASPPYASPTEFINRWLMHFRESFWTAELQSAVLLPILREMIHPGRAASLAEIVDRIRLRDKSPAGKAAADRLESISLSYPKLYESTADRWSELHEQSLYCPTIGTLTPATRFVTWLLIIERFAYLQHRAHRDRVHTVVFLDEAQTSLSKRTQTISGLPSTPVQLLPTTREHGLQFVVATPSWTELDPLVLSQFQVQIALQPSDGRELDSITKSFRLTPAQARLTSSMQRGTALGKIRGIGQPFLFTYEPFREQKDIDPATVSAARARAERFCDASNSAAKEGIASNGQPTPAESPRRHPHHRHALRRWWNKPIRLTLQKRFRSTSASARSSRTSHNVASSSSPNSTQSCTCTRCKKAEREKTCAPSASSKSIASRHDPAAAAQASPSHSRKKHTRNSTYQKRISAKADQRTDTTSDACAIISAPHSKCMRQTRSLRTTANATNDFRRHSGSRSTTATQSGSKSK